MSQPAQVIQSKGQIIEKVLQRKATHNISIITLDFDFKFCFKKTDVSLMLDILFKHYNYFSVEKRRRSFINDRIAELQSLLPEDVNR
jgi:hypothetical protein